MTFPLLLAVLLAGCASDYTLLQTDDQFAHTRQTNYYAFNHAFTDQAEAAVRTKAEAPGARHSLVAVRTSRPPCPKSGRANSLCMHAEAAKSYAP